MTHLVLARRLRPKKFEEVAGQTAIVESLKNSIRDKRIGHAYLFSGTRGIGKTTIARLFAKSLRCLNPIAGSACDKCECCLANDTSVDIIEIDGASNNTVEGVRDLIANCRYLPTQGTYKIYIIDEVHMLSQSAFNALLKTLEEPPSHVIFILATTEAEKLPETVLSRCQHFNFRRASPFDLTTYIKQLQQSEGIRFEAPDLLNQIADAANGSYRDLLTILEQLTALSDKSGLISESSLVSVLGISSRSTIEKTVKALLVADESTLKEMFSYINERNIDLTKFTEQLLSFIFRITMEKTFASYNVGLAEVIWVHEELSRDFSWALHSPTPSESVFICMLKVLHRRSFIKSLTMTGARDLEEHDSSKKEQPPKKSFVYREFVDSVRAVNPTVAANLEHGNVKLLDQQNGLNVVIAFHDKNKVLMDFISEPAIKVKVVDLAKKIYEVEQATIIFEILANDPTFRSLHDDLEIEIQAENEKRQDVFLQNPVLKKVETLFNTKVEKVILNHRQ